MNIVATLSAPLVLLLAPTGATATATTAAPLSASASADAKASAKAVRPPPLRGAQCLDPRQARSWIDLDGDRLLVDAGRHRYLLHIGSACTALGYSTALDFRGDRISGRVCGTLGDEVITRDYPCRIESIELLSKEQYKQALDQRKGEREARRAAKKAGKS